MKRGLVLLAVLLGACATSDPRCPAVPEGGRYCLQSFGGRPAFDVQQTARIRQGERDDTMIVMIEADGQAMNFVGMTPFGQKVLQLQCTEAGGKAILSPHERLDPSLFCAMLQWTHWPADSVRAGLQPPLRLEEAPFLRRIYAGEKLIYAVDFPQTTSQSERMALRLPSFDMRIDIQQTSAAR